MSSKVEDGELANYETKVEEPQRAVDTRGYLRLRGNTLHVKLSIPSRPKHNSGPHTQETGSSVYMHLFQWFWLGAGRRLKGNVLAGRKLWLLSAHSLHIIYKTYQHMRLIGGAYFTCRSVERELQGAEKK